MAKQFSGWQCAILMVLLVCVCCTFASIGAVATYVLWEESAGARVQATLVPTSTRVVATGSDVGAPVFMRTPTRVANPYQVIIPTPTAPPLTAPIAFISEFRVVTYTVSGKTINEISKSLEANAMPDPNEPGSRYYALTRWQLFGDWTVRPSLHGCEVVDGKVSVAITMTLPALVTPNVPSDVRQRFDTFMQKTVLHESDHVEITLHGAREYQRALSNYTPAPNCDILKSQLSTLFRQNFDAIQRANREYDAKTQHGRTQGAVFP
jgi:predicted secreted Zn-dependent protease